MRCFPEVLVGTRPHPFFLCKLVYLLERLRLTPSSIFTPNRNSTDDSSWNGRTWSIWAGLVYKVWVCLARVKLRSIAWLLNTSGSSLEMKWLIGARSSTNLRYDLFFIFALHSRVLYVFLATCF